MRPVFNKGESREDIAKFIAWYWKEYGFPPSYRDIGAAVGLKSSASVHYHLDRMEYDGQIVKDTYRRSVRLVPGAFPRLCTHDWRIDPEVLHVAEVANTKELQIQCRWCDRITAVEQSWDRENIDTWLRFMGNP